MKNIKINHIEIANESPFVLIAGLNVIEDDKTVDEVISTCIKTTKNLNIPYIFKKLLN